MTEIIFIVENISTNSFENLTKKYPNSKIFCLGFSSHKNLEKLGIHHEIGEYLLSENDKKIIDQLTYNSTINWYNEKKLQHFLMFENVNLGSFMELELLHYFLALYRNAMTIIKIFEKEKPKTVISSSYLNNFVKNICETNSINFYEHDEFEQPLLYADKINIKFNFLNKPLSFHISRNLYLKFTKYFQKFIDVFFNFKPDFNSTRESILLVDFNPLIFDDLLKELSKTQKNILLLNQRRPAIWNLKSFNIVKNNACKIVNLNEFEKYLTLESKNYNRVFLENLSNMWRYDSVFEEMFKLDSYSLWSSIKKSFINMCNQRFKESINHLSLLKKLFETVNISVILEWAETGQEEKELLYLANQQNIFSMMLQHNLFSSSETWKNYDRFVIGLSYPFLSSKQIIWDEFTNSQAISNGIKKENLLLLGSPKHDKFYNHVPKSTKNIILLATTAPTHISIEMTPFDANTQFENFIREVCRICENFPDKQLVVKPHPQADYYTNITALIREIDPTIPIIYEANLVELIDSCDLLITFNNSTIALESIILDKPTISLQFEKWAEEDDIVKTNALMSISKLDDVENGIKELLYDEKIKNVYRNNRKTFLQKFSNRGSASKELAKVLDRSSW